jgi:signal transduction histidine kinase
MPAMNDARVRACWVAIAYIAIVLFGQLILSTTPYELDASVTPETRAVNVALEAFWVVALVVLMVRQPTSQLWKILLVWEVVGTIWVLGYLPVEARPIIDIPVYILGELWAAVFIHVILAYPSGRLIHQFDRRFVTFVYAFAIGIKVVGLLLGPEECWPVCGNPIRWFPSIELTDLISKAATLLIPILMGLALVELWRHWRLAGPAGRRAVWPMLLAAPIWCITAFSGYFADAFLDEAAQVATHSWNVLGVIQSLTIPLAILVGVFRTRLARGNVAALALELGQGVPVGGLRAVLARALRDPTLELAFPAPSGDGYVDPLGRPIAVPRDGARAVTAIEREGATLAVLIHDPVDLVEDPGLVAAVGSVAMLALENERLSAQVRAQLEEVRASRERIIEAGDAERRRVERDLHDGAQQRLVALAIRLQTARHNTPGAAVLLDEATAEIQTAVAEVRALARGLHPTILSDLGLAAAVDALAERTPIPVTVDIPETRFPPAVEATAYYVVAEAITNLTRYANAREASVTATVEEDRLITIVKDDGRGGADATLGSGLRGLADRVSAADGRLEVRSPVGVGTTVRVELPLT